MTNNLQLHWQGNLQSIAFDTEGIKACLHNLDYPVYVVRHDNKIGIANEGNIQHGKEQGHAELLAFCQPLIPEQLGSADFREFHGVRYAYSSGAMANGISSTDLVIAMGQAGMLGSFGAAGLIMARIEESINIIQQALPTNPYMFNLIHSPAEVALEQNAVELYLKHDVTTIEASAFLNLTPYIVYYRVAGLSLDQQNQINIKNKIVAKISRREVATKFMQPPPKKILDELVQSRYISTYQAQLAEHVPMADDITIEADSGGHTDNRPLVCLLPSMLKLRDEIQAKYNYPHQIRVGAAGGISTPDSALASFMMGADYIVTGSVNQACVESGACEHTRKLLAQADMADVIMAPAADMFEMGVKLQVLKRGTLFPMRAQKLYDLYSTYDSIESIPANERVKIEKQIFRRNLDEVWQDTVAFFNERDPRQVERAKNNFKRKMALIFRWYLGLSSRWSNQGEKGREIDYQIWCGPSMGAFNDWVRGTYLAELSNRRVVTVAKEIMRGTAFLYRLRSLQMQGVQLPNHFSQYQI
ncbi:MAG: 2-nitropropane dioxygenase [Anaerolineaceae bacterium 4572_78]|nr:MAG: 2-nitropropane dioxygenase [Anaerolineaceae bacterium 4572_78]